MGIRASARSPTEHGYHCASGSLVDVKKWEGLKGQYFDTRLNESFNNSQFIVQLVFPLWLDLPLP